MMVLGLAFLRETLGDTGVSHVITAIGLQIVEKAYASFILKL
jgi:hypothetical protein